MNETKITRRAIADILGGHDFSDEYFVIPAGACEDIAHELDACTFQPNVLCLTGIAARDGMNELRQQALRHLANGFLDLLGARVFPGNEAKRFADGYGALRDKLQTLANIEADEEETDDDDMERLTALSPLTLDELDRKARDIYDTGHSTVRQRYLTALAHEFEDLLGL